MADKFIPYGRQEIDDGDVQAVAEALRSDWLTTGPTVERFENAFADFAGSAHAVTAANGTAALHLTMLAAGVGPGDEVIVPPLTFAATANCARYLGATVVFADIRPDTLTIDVDQVAARITPRTKAIIAVDYAGLPCDLDELMTLAERHDLLVVEDAAHALGADYRGRRIGSIAHMTTFSLHPVKHITTGEGGVVTTNDAKLAERLRRLRNHGISSDHRQRQHEGTWRYDVVELGFNYRLTDIQCALGLSQLKKAPARLERRRALAAAYGKAFAKHEGLRVPVEPGDRNHAWHLYVVRLAGENVAARRQRMFNTLRAAQIGANVHYLPVYLFSYYRSLGYEPGLCPVAEREYDGLLSLPMWAGLSDEDQQRVIRTVIAAESGHDS